MGGGTVRLVGKRRMVSVGGMLTALARDRAGLLSLLMGALLSFAGDGTGRLSPFCATGACGLWMAGYAPWPALVGGLAGSLFLGRMTNLFDGVSFVVRKNAGAQAQEGGVSKAEIKGLIAEALRDFAASMME